MKCNKVKDDNQNKKMDPPQTTKQEQPERNPIKNCNIITIKDYIWEFKRHKVVCLLSFLIDLPI